MPAGGVCSVLSYLRFGIIMASTMKNIGHESSTSTVYVTNSPMPALREGEVLIKVESCGHSTIKFNILMESVMCMTIGECSRCE